MEVLFNWCCEVMQSLANFTGFTYKEVNVIVFIFLMPMVDIALLLLFVVKYVQYREKKRFIKQLESHC
ncbi:hypothetical protein JMN11_01595 [Capnocytophaga genosp. AHN8471]|uniref:hypothetical protein n=1 Tax=Capnocytophaga genosp. AHN8471 TaxID=327574 RepID=UPI0019325CA9|nr:hypothetical protein [Capnocytophaga genosp. AHN8471]MBM0652384.1 hypothetical protein [Capnocytophaga genosp. AHN8471]